MASVRSYQIKIWENEYGATFVMVRNVTLGYVSEHGLSIPRNREIRWVNFYSYELTKRFFNSHLRVIGD